MGVIDFQNGGLEHQVYELIAKMCELGRSDWFPKFKTEQMENNKWRCTLSIPGIKKHISGEGTTEVQSINICALGATRILENEYSKEQLDPEVKNSIFEPRIEEYFSGCIYDKEYLYRMIETDILVDSNDELFYKLLRDRSISEIKKYMFDEETVDSISDLVSVRILVKERKTNYC